MNRHFAMAFWNIHTALLVLRYTVLPFPALERLAGWCDARGNDFDLAHGRARDSEDFG